jgi:hypothetical protein
MKLLASLPANGAASACAVVDLADARDGRRLRDLDGRLRASVERNRHVLARLFQSGAVYSRAGARLGRELLLARQHLLKVGDLLTRLGDLAGRRDAELASLARQIESILQRTAELSARGEALVAREP